MTEKGSDSASSTTVRQLPVDKEIPVSTNTEPADTTDTIKTKSAKILHIRESVTFRG